MVPFVNRLLDIDVCFDTNVNIPTMYKVRMPTMKLLPWLGHIANTLPSFKVVLAKSAENMFLAMFLKKNTNRVCYGVYTWGKRKTNWNQK